MELQTEWTQGEPVMVELTDKYLSINATILNAIEKIDQGKIGITLVLDENKRLLGTITDGDVRRGLLKGLSLTDSVEKIMNKNSVFCTTADSSQKIIELGRTKSLHQIPIVDEDGMVVRIETVDIPTDFLNRENKVFIMAGGLGSRLMPLTKETPKPMLKVGNRPILETIVLGLKRSGFKQFVFCVNHLSSVITDYFQDGSQYGVSIEYIHEEDKLGTAGALGLWNKEINAPFIVMNGDLLTNLNFDQLLNFHVEQKALATMCLKEHVVNVPYGVVNVEGARVTSLVEKPMQRYFINAGIYVLDPAILNLIPEKKYFDMTQLLGKALEMQKNVSSFPIHEYWMDVGQPQDFQLAANTFNQFFKN